MSAFKVEIKGVKETKQALGNISRELLKEFNKGIKSDARPLFEAYKSYASNLGGEGDYAAHASMRQIANGVKIINTDPGAGTIEFANIGAFYRSGKRAGSRIGVPTRPKPRALMRAVDEYEPDVVQSIDNRISDVIERYLNG